MDAIDWPPDESMIACFFVLPPTLSVLPPIFHRILLSTSPHQLRCLGCIIGTLARNTLTFSTLLTNTTYVEEGSGKAPRVGRQLDRLGSSTLKSTRRISMVSLVLMRHSGLYQVIHSFLSDIRPPFFNRTCKTLVKIPMRAHAGFGSIGSPRHSPLNTN